MLLGVTMIVTRQQLESQCLQAVANEQGRRFVVLDVAGRPPAPQHVVVHARQIVVDQRIGVDQLDGAGRDFEALMRGVRQFAGGKSQ